MGAVGQAPLQDAQGEPFAAAQREAAGAGVAVRVRVPGAAERAAVMAVAVLMPHGSWVRATTVAASSPSAAARRSAIASTARRVSRTSGLPSSS